MTSPLESILSPDKPSEDCLSLNHAFIELCSCWLLDPECYRNPRSSYIREDISICYDYTYKHLLEHRMIGVGSEKLIMIALIKHILRYLPEEDDLFLHDILEKTYPIQKTHPNYRGIKREGHWNKHP